MSSEDEIMPKLSEYSAFVLKISLNVRHGGEGSLLLFNPSSKSLKAEILHRFFSPYIKSLIMNIEFLASIMFVFRSQKLKHKADVVRNCVCLNGHEV